MSVDQNLIDQFKLESAQPSKNQPGAVDTPRISRHMKIGEMAVQKNLLTIKQVMTVLRGQADWKRPFGELAVDLGYLAQDDLENLLQVQQSLVTV